MRVSLLVNARLATLDPARPGPGVAETAAIDISGRRIALACAEADLPGAAHDGDRMDCENRWVAPGLIDCHTRRVHSGRGARA
jgi:imidazolonepropionase